MTGFGRTGTFFAHEQAGITPDFLCLSKGITGGYLPLSVVLTRDAIYEAFYDDAVTRGFLHSHSYTGNALACRAALATLDIFEADDVIEANRAKAAAMNAQVASARATSARARFPQHRDDLGVRSRRATIARVGAQGLRSGARARAPAAADRRDRLLHAAVHDDATRSRRCWYERTLEIVESLVMIAYARSQRLATRASCSFVACRSRAHGRARRDSARPSRRRSPRAAFPNRASGSTSTRSARAQPVDRARRRARAQSRVHDEARHDVCRRSSCSGPRTPGATEIYAAGPLQNDVLAGDLVIKGYGDPKLTLENFWLLLRKLARARRARDPRRRGARPHAISRRTISTRRASTASRSGPTTPVPTRCSSTSRRSPCSSCPSRRRAACASSPSPRSTRCRSSTTSTLDRRRRAATGWRSSSSTRRAAPTPRASSSAARIARDCGERARSFSLLAHRAVRRARFSRSSGESWAARSRARARRARSRRARGCSSSARSPALSEVVRDINKYSNNVMARQLFLTLGRARAAARPARWRKRAA